MALHRRRCSRSCGNCCISCTKPCPSSCAEQVLGRQRTSLKNSSEVSSAFSPILSSLRPRAEARRLVGLDHHQRDALGAARRVGLGDDDDQIGVLAVGDEGLRAVEHVVVAALLGRACDALQVGAGAGLGHGDGADQLAGRQLRQPALLLLLGAVVEDVGRDDAGMQRRAERRSRQGRARG